MLLPLIVLSTVLTAAWGVNLQEAYAWKELEYAWPSPEAKDAAIKSGQYIDRHNLPLGLDRWNDKLFITVPRWKSGVASSLNYVKITPDSSNRSPVLKPYPSWEANTLPAPQTAPAVTEERHGGRDSAPKAKLGDVQLQNNATIVSTFRIRVDECDRLWVMDTGLADILGEPSQVAKPALVIFDLRTDQLIRRYTFKDSDSKEDTFFANVIVDTTPGDCENAYAYVPDLGAYGVVVYSLKDNTSWRVKHNYFHFEPLSGEYDVGGVNFQWTDGVFGMALSKAQPDGSRTAYFHALSSTKEFSVPTRVLQNKTYSQSPESYHEYKLVGDRGLKGQSSASFYDEETGVLFYTQVNKNGVGCWNSAKPYGPETQGVVAADNERLIFPNDLKIDREGTIWVLSDRMPLFIYTELDPTQYNYRILKTSVKEAIAGTPCS